MIISEKQIMQLMQLAQVYLNALDSLYKFDKNFLTDAGLHNKKQVAKLLEQISNQQSDELKIIE